MDHVTVRVDASGRVVIPRDLRDASAFRMAASCGFRSRMGNCGRPRASRPYAASGRSCAALPPAEPATEALIAGRRAEAARGLHEEPGHRHRGKPPGRG